MSTRLHSAPIHRTALVTAGHKRLGHAIALDLARAGFDVAIQYGRDEAAAARAVTDIRALGRQALAFHAELGDLTALQQLVANAAEGLGGLSHVYAVAASYDRTPLDQLSGDDLDRAFAVNARSTVALALAARPLLAASGDGRIIVLGDLAAQVPFRDYLAHSMAKAALHAAVRGLASELAPDVVVNAIVPGAVLQPDDLPARTWQRLLHEVPQGDVVAHDPGAGTRAIAEAALYLATCSRFVNGTFLTVDGGRTARW